MPGAGSRPHVPLDGLPDPAVIAAVGANVALIGRAAALHRSDQELRGESPRLLGLGPVVLVDTSGEVDMRQLIARLDRVLAT